MAEYWGETARTAFERGEEHLVGMESRQEKNSLWKHSYLHHQGELVREDLQMNIIEKHKSPLNRQIHEGVELELNRADIVLNSKSEWNHSKIPRITIEVGEEIEEDLQSGMARATDVGVGGLGRKRKFITVKAAGKRERREEEREVAEAHLGEGQVGGKRKKLKIEKESQQIGSAQERRVKIGKDSKKTRGKIAKTEEENLASGKRLEGWLSAYGITRGEAIGKERGIYRSGEGGTKRGNN